MEERMKKSLIGAYFAPQFISEEVRRQLGVDVDSIEQVRMLNDDEKVTLIGIIQEARLKFAI